MDLKRYPVIANDPLQAWDAADELILEHCHSLNLDGQRILILGDSFGYLSLNLEEFHPVSYTDSYVSSQGLSLNSQGRLSALHDLRDLKGPFDVVILKLPKNLSYLEDLVYTLTGLTKEGSILVCGGMVKHMASGHFEMIQKIGPTTTSLAKKKARLIFASFDGAKKESIYPLKVNLEGRTFLHHSNLFSREKLDIGTRFFLENLPQGNFETILDLGCANGIVGIKAQELNPSARVIFSDDSYMAILSAQENVKAHAPHPEKTEFKWLNCYEGQKLESVDLVLCNPPFHQGNTIGDFIAWQMICDAERALKRGGKMVVIGNSHLGYQIKLKKRFGNSRITTTNSKFMIAEAIKT